MRWKTIDGSEGAIIHHFWIDTYGQLFKKHWRYIRIEGKARYKTGERFRIVSFLMNSLRLTKHQLRPASWWNDGLLGLFLCSFFVWYETSARLSLLIYQVRHKTRLIQR